MAKKKKTETKKIKNSTKKIISALIPRNRKIKIVLYIILAIFFTMASFGFAGRIGDFLHQEIIKDAIGYAFFMIPLIFLFSAWKLKKNIEINLKDKIMYLISGVSLASLFHIFLSKNDILAGGGIGLIIGDLLLKGFDIYFSSLLLFGILIMSIIILVDPHLEFYKKLKERNEEKNKYKEDEKEAEEKLQAIIDKTKTNEPKKDETSKEEKTTQKGTDSSTKKFSIPGIKKKKKEDELSMEDVQSVFASSYKTPPLSLLGKSGGKPSTGDIKANANLIQRTLMNFGIAVEMDEISVGPTVTRYAMKPAQGVRLSRIASLQNELALALAAKSIRIEAPIPGRSLVGIEVPNRVASSIGLGSILTEKEYTQSDKPLLVSLGKGVSGKSYFANLAKMPHALIAGATGSGKSVTIHNIIMSLLYKNGPDMLRFIMVDPKRVELTLYKKIPHLLTPVITDPKKAVLALKWAVKEMERRYDLLQKKAVRDIDSYHKTIVAPAYKGLSTEEIEDRALELPEKMPYIVVIIDELSDIMSAYPQELESAIVRLAQMSRAVGIHLLLATQRPSVNVITGLIKANVPSRMALKVASQIDSRTILDSRGAEKLLGKGDMLYKGEGVNEAIRVQCPFVSEAEVKSVVKYIQKNYQFELEDEIIIPDEHLSDGGGGFEKADGNSSDPLYEDAKQVVIAAKKASTSYLQRRLSIGYSRAAKIIDILEDNGVIGPANGSKPREVYEQAEKVDSAEDEVDYE
jgi:S-DNA-T family DNA segregation ATPase FtsK/SpoIIIE